MPDLQFSLRIATSISPTISQREILVITANRRNQEWVVLTGSIASVSTRCAYRYIIFTTITEIKITR